jgi:predicted nucleotide-binding protein (sugar kinase/HSP70/actin superfamily)
MDLEKYKSVQKWLKELRDRRYKGLEINSRLELLKKFCDFVAKNPDELVNEVYNFDTHKPRVKKRDNINERINEFVGGLELSSSMGATYGNMIEGFFLYNGVRMFRNRKVWTHPGRITSD